MPAHDPHTGAGPPPVRVRLVGGAGEARTFTRAFRIGRDEACDVEVAHGKVSRVHVEVAFEDGRWWARDAGSSNGTFRDSIRVERVALDGPLHLQLGAGGPEVSFDVVTHAAAREGTRPGRAPSLTPRPAVDRPSKGSGAAGVGAPADAAPGAQGDPPRDPSLTYFIRHYAGGADAGPAGERTMMVREAFRHVQHKQRVRYSGLIAAAVVVALGALGYGAFRAIEHTAARARIAAQDATIQLQEARLAVLQRQARTIFYMLKQRELQASLASATGAPRTEAEREAVRVAEATYVQYERFVDSLGVYDSLNAEDRIIYRMARLFGECDVDVPPDFVAKVHEYIGIWKRSGGLRLALRRARDNGYTQPIAAAFIEQGVRPQFFYLGLVESQFNADAVGTPTRFGFAKGMWQFIPGTAADYGLRVGPLVAERVTDPDDERHDVRKSTAAAARYIRRIYQTDAQASGLLVMASYNWGEGNVVRYIRSLPASPSERNWWKLVGRYGNRIPRETYDYVFRIFSAAVIGENPRLFGFDFDDPITAALGEGARPTVPPETTPAAAPAPTVAP